MTELQLPMTKDVLCLQLVIAPHTLPLASKLTHGGPLPTVPSSFPILQLKSSASTPTTPHAHCPDSPPFNPCSPGSHDNTPSSRPPKQRGTAGRLPGSMPTGRHGGRQSRRHAQISRPSGDVPTGFTFPEEPCLDTRGTKVEGNGVGADRNPQEGGIRQGDSDRLHGRSDLRRGTSLLGQEAQVGGGEDTNTCSTDAGISFSAPYMGRSPFAISTCLDDESEGEPRDPSPRPPFLRSPRITLEGRQMRAMEAVDTHYVPDLLTARATQIDAADSLVTQATAFNAAEKIPVAEKILELPSAVVRERWAGGQVAKILGPESQSQAAVIGGPSGRVHAEDAAAHLTCFISQPSSYQPQLLCSVSKRHIVGGASVVRDPCPRRSLGSPCTPVEHGAATAPPPSDVSSLTPFNSPAHSHGSISSPTACSVSRAVSCNTSRHIPHIAPSPGSTPSSPQQRLSIPLPSHTEGHLLHGSRLRERAVTFDGMIGFSGHSASIPLSAFAPSAPPKPSLAQSPVTHSRASSPVELRAYGSTPLPATSQELHHKRKPPRPSHGPKLNPVRSPSRQASASLYRNGVTSGFSNSAAASVISCSTASVDLTHHQPLFASKAPKGGHSREHACRSVLDLSAALSPASSLHTRDSGSMPRLAPGDSRKGSGLLSMRSVGEFGLDGVGDDDDELLQAVTQDPWWDGVMRSPEVMELPMRSSGSFDTWDEEQDTDRWTADAAAIIKIFVSWLQVGAGSVRVVVMGQ